MPSTLKTLLACLILYVIFVLYMNAHAQTYKVRITYDPPLGVKIKNKSNLVDIMAAYDNGDGTSSMIFTACDTTITAVISNKDMKNHDTEIVEILADSIKKACAP